MELPYHLKTLEPLTGALDIIRFLGEIEAPTADSDEILDGLNLSERTFGKAIRRLVTKGYVQMEGEMIYRLTRQGREAVDILGQYDEEQPESSGIRRDVSEPITRRLVVAVPAALSAGEPTNIAVGLEGATDEETGVLYSPADMVVRLSVLNGEPTKPQEAALILSNYPVTYTFRVTPGNYQQMRVRVQVFQLGPNPDDINISGGLYVDADVTSGEANDTPIAYGSDIQIVVE